MKVTPSLLEIRDFRLAFDGYEGTAHVLNGIDLSSPDYHYFTYGYSKGLDKQNGKHSGRSAPPPFESQGDQPIKSKAAHA